MLLRLRTYRKSIYLLCIVFLAISLYSHSRSESYSRIDLALEDSIYIVSLSGNIRSDVFNDLPRAQSFKNIGQLQDYLIGNINFPNHCKIADAPNIINNESAGFIKFNINYICEDYPSFVAISLFQDLGINHNHIARFYFQKELINESIISNASQTINLENETGIERTSSFNNFFWLGLKHILSGLDHLTFLLGLVLLFLGRSLVIAITGFTIGHSITLGLGSMGILIVDITIVEMLIGFSILTLALESIARQSPSFLNSNLFILSFLIIGGLILFFGARFYLLTGLALFLWGYLNLIKQSSNNYIPQIITIFFGLIHGLGFASNLAQNNLIQDQIIVLILGFNLGIEAGQIFIAFIMIILLWIIKTLFKESYHLFVIRSLSTVLVSAGLFWFVTRSIML